MVSATGLDGGKDPPGTLWIVNQFQRFRDIRWYLLSKKSFLSLLLQKNFSYLNKHEPQTFEHYCYDWSITETLDDHKKVLFVIDNVPLTPVSLTPPTDIQEDNVDLMPLIPVPSLLPPSPSYISTPATITATYISEHIVLSVGGGIYNFFCWNLQFKQYSIFPQNKYYYAFSLVLCTYLFNCENLSVSRYTWTWWLGVYKRSLQHYKYCTNTLGFVAYSRGTGFPRIGWKFPFFPKTRELPEYHPFLFLVPVFPCSAILVIIFP